MVIKFTQTIAFCTVALIVGASPIKAGHHEPLRMIRPTQAAAVDLKPYVKSYATLVHHSYRDAHVKAMEMLEAIDAFLDNPNARTQRVAQKAWIEARKSYLQTEAFRFYEGPIDYIDSDTGEEGPEARINAWPINEAFIDYVRGRPRSGIINNKSFEISIETILENDQVEDEADVTTGWHAIEFLLWGQDFNDNGPGQRSYEDFIPDRRNNNRRRQYLEIVTRQLVQDLRLLEDEWKPRANNYRAEFVKGDPQESVKKIFTALATLSAFEMASERMAVPLDSGDQEDEHSCFSDTTHFDFIYNALGIHNVYLGDHGDTKGLGFDELLKQVDPDLNRSILVALRKTDRAVANINHPFDRVLATPKGSPERQQVEMAIAAFEEQAPLFQELGAVLGVNVEILAE